MFRLANSFKYELRYSPPFLSFDISIIFRESNKTLDILPREDNAYNETYRLGGITSYVHHRRHYVGYILHNGYFLYCDGIPSSNPVLKKYEGNGIEGNISLLCYFPCDDISYDVNITNEVEFCFADNDHANNEQHCGRQSLHNDTNLNLNSNACAPRSKITSNGFRAMNESCFLHYMHYSNMHYVLCHHISIDYLLYIARSTYVYDPYHISIDYLLYIARSTYVL